VTAAPDYCEPVVGWRVWSLSAVDGRARLGSHVSPTVWPPGREWVATCDARRRELRRPWRAHPTGHAAPAPRCTCGVHAMGDIRFLTTYLTPAARPYAWLRPLVHHVIGRVALGGHGVVGGGGWRAARAYPNELWLPPLDVDRGEVPRSETVAIDLADYGMPVHVCDGQTAREVIEMLARPTNSNAKVKG
jgi:hypothetical protein